MQEKQSLVKKCLVVDDDSDIRRHLRHILENIGLKVAEAENGAQAIEILEKDEAPSIILLDQTMPVMDGITTLKKINSMGNKMASTKVIMVTALGTYNLGVEAIKNGAADFIVKPFHKVLIVHAVKTALNQILFERSENKKREHEIQLKTIVNAGVTLNHEVNSPLQVILSSTKLIEQGGQLKDSANEIRQSVNKIKKVLEKFSKATKVETKEYLSGTEMIDIDKLDEG